MPDGQDLPLAMLKANLGYFDSAIPAALEAYLQNLLEKARQDLSDHENIFVIPNDPSDTGLLVMYAAWLYRKASTGEGKPPMLREEIRNRQVSSATAW